MSERAERPLEDPMALLERAFIEQFLREHHHTLDSIVLLPPDQRRLLMVKATQHATVRLAEVDARSAYVHEIHGAKEG
jgi:hypothetical protein